MRPLLPLLLLVACKKDGEDTAPAAPPPPPTWDARAAEAPCAGDLQAPLLDSALADAGITSDQLGYDEQMWVGASYAAVLDDPFRLPWFRDTHWDALRGTPCFAVQTSVDLDHAAASDHPVANALTEAAQRLGTPLELQPIDPSTAEQSFADLSGLPDDLAQALTPILAAMVAVHEAQDAINSKAPASKPDMVEAGHGGVLIEFTVEPDLTLEENQDWIVGKKGPAVFHDPARVLAFAVEHADLERFEGREITAEIGTDLGKIVVAGPGADAPGDIGNIALYLDLGGDDVYTHPAGANNARVAAAVHVDLGGNDTYTYESVGTPEPGLLPGDADGRYQGDSNYGRVSLSRVGRQGSGRFGVGLLFDLGAGDDRYESLRASQGWGALGVGALFDDGGSDTYLGEAGVQGAASMGIGLLMDLGDGSDRYETYADSQGFGWVQGIGIAYDGGGGDVWWSDPGDPALGGHPVYASAQLPGAGNSSFTQGAGFGLRNDAASTFLSGGLGVLRDAAGDDAYTASVFAQGTGYWQGTGLLLDGEGADSYDALWYVQGGAAHYAIGALLDDGPGNDRFNPNFDPRNVHLGSGHDFSVGLLVNEQGDDTYNFTTLAAGSSNCQGIGVFVDNAGSDTYVGTSDRSVGLGNHSAECEAAERTVARSVGIFVDSGGDADSWSIPVVNHPAPADNANFGYQYAGTDDERGGAVDGMGETAFHAGPAEE